MIPYFAIFNSTNPILLKDENKILYKAAKMTVPH